MPCPPSAKNLYLFRQRCETFAHRREQIEAPAFWASSPNPLARAAAAVSAPFGGGRERVGRFMGRAWAAGASRGGGHVTHGAGSGWLGSFLALRPYAGREGACCVKFLIFQDFSCCFLGFGSQR